MKPEITDDTEWTEREVLGLPDPLSARERLARQKKD